MATVRVEFLYLVLVSMVVGSSIGVSLAASAIPSGAAEMVGACQAMMQNGDGMEGCARMMGTESGEMVAACAQAMSGSAGDMARSCQAMMGGEEMTGHCAKMMRSSGGMMGSGKMMGMMMRMMGGGT